MNYLALTIGPIIETLSESKKTKELFAGSYLFSYFMKELLYRLYNADYKLIVPYHEDIGVLLEATSSVGMFHDRLIVSHTKNQELIAEDIDGYIGTVIQKITNGVVARDEKNNKKYKKQIEEFFKAYFQISYVIDNEFSLKTFNNQLDVAELHREFILSTDSYKVLFDQEGKRVNPLIYLQRRFHKSFLKDVAFGDEKSDFLSVLEISLQTKIEYEFDKEDSEENNKKKEEEALKDVNSHQKYMALIQGDGDKIGKILSSIDANPQEVKKFSQTLLDFSQVIPIIAQEYGATVVYAGGDDMLAFAPMLNESGTVFDFLVKLDKKFKNMMKELNLPEVQNVSQSFGVSLFYYKKPLYQALNKALYNLFSVAKSGEERNRAVVELIKHSGQTYKADMFLTSNSYELFSKLMKSEPVGEELALPHGVAHNLKRSAKLLKNLADEVGDELAFYLENFFTNNFNKEVHSSKNVQEALALVRKLLYEELKGYITQKSEDEEKNQESFDRHFNHFTSLLSIIKHLRGDR